MDYGSALMNKSKVIGFGKLFDGLYSIKLQNYNAYSSMHVFIGLKRCVVINNSFIALKIEIYIQLENQAISK